MPVDDIKLSPLPWDNSKSYKADDVEIYNTTIEETCLYEQIKIMDIRHNLLNLDYRKYLADGLHPNSLGIKLFMNLLRVS